MLTRYDFLHRYKTCLASALIVTTVVLANISSMAATESPRQKESVRGTYCYHYGDDQSYKIARETAFNLALREAIRSHRVYIEAATRVKNFQLENDIIASTTAALLKEAIVEKEDRKPQEVCLTVSASLNPSTTEETIRQRLAAKEVAIEAKTAAIPAHQDFGLKVWTNKPTNSFVENERLIIYVKSERDVYLKLDYFQADGTVAHLVPNKYRGQGHITGGRTYAFGDDTSPEQFIVQAPYGDEVIKAIARLTPFDLSNEPTEVISDSRAYITNLRGIRLIGAESSVSLKTESTAVSEQTQAIKKPTSPGAAQP